MKNVMVKIEMNQKREDRSIPEKGNEGKYAHILLLILFNTWKKLKLNLVV